jgi:hypothetical protein
LDSVCLEEVAEESLGFWAWWLLFVDVAARPSIRKPGPDSESVCFGTFAFLSHFVESKSVDLSKHATKIGVVDMMSFRRCAAMLAAFLRRGVQSGGRPGSSTSRMKTTESRSRTRSFVDLGEKSRMKIFERCTMDTATTMHCPNPGILAFTKTTVGSSCIVLTNATPRES